MEMFSEWKTEEVIGDHTFNLYLLTSYVETPSTISD